MDKRIENIFGKSKIYNVEESVLVEEAMCISIFKNGNKTELIISGKLFCSAPAEIIPISDVKLLSNFSSSNDIIKYIKDGRHDERLEQQKKLVHILKVYNKMNLKKSSGSLYRRESIEFLN